MGWKMPSACTCGCAFTAAMSWMGEAGMPAASSSASHSALLRVAHRRSDSNGTITSRCAIRSLLVRKRGSVPHSGWPSTAAELGKQPVVGGGHHDLAVRRVEGLEDDQLRVAGAVARRLPARHVVAGDVLRHPADAGLQQAGVHHAPLAGHVAPLQAARQPSAAQTPVPRSSTCIPTRARRAVDGTVHAEHAGEGLHRRLVARVQRLRPLGAEAVQVAADQARVDRAQRLGAQAHGLQRAGPHVLHEDVAGPSRTPSARPRRLGPSGPAPRCACCGSPRGSRWRCRRRRAGPSRGVVALGPLDLGDLGAQHAQDLGGIGAGQVLPRPRRP